MNNLSRLALLAVLSVLSLHATAQAWPQRPVRLVLSLGPGAGADIGARLFADRLAKRWGQPVVVENRPGADGVVAINAVINARDNHTLLWGPTANLAGHPYVMEKLPYDPKELVPVARVTSTVVVIAVPAALNVGSMKELLARAREQPGKMNWASVVAMTDIIIAGYLKGAGLDMVRISYKDTVSAINDLAEGRIQMYSAAYAIMRPQAQGGRIRLLAVQNRSRVPGLDLPTVAEAGFPEMTFDGLVGIISARSSGLTDAARDRIAADIKAVAADPVVAERLVATAQINNPGDAAEFAASMDEQAAQLARFAKMLGTTPGR
jgi:tripartite-type tricarboxylate transporter receptor subunit TctC